MASDLDLLDSNSVKETDAPKRVHLPNGDVSLVTHTGNRLLTTRSTISDVLYVPQLKYNLLSVSKLTKDLQCVAFFYPDFVFFRISSLGR